MLDSILATIIAAAITGPAGYILKTRFTRNRYLPGALPAGPPNAYAFISGDWFFYHFTYDPKMSSHPVLSMGEMALTLEKDLIVVGRDEVIEMNHRRALHYQLRGEIRAGQLFLTGVCVEDPSDAYTCIFPNLLDDETTGIMIARDYARYLYASPTLLTKKRLPEIEAEQVLQRSDVRLYKAAS